MIVYINLSSTLNPVQNYSSAMVNLQSSPMDASPLSDSDSLAPRKRLFGRERPIHAVLGGGKGTNYPTIRHSMNGKEEVEIFMLFCTNVQ